MGVRVLGIEPDGLAELRDGVGGPALLRLQCVPQVVVGDGVQRALPDRVGPDGLLGAVVQVALDGEPAERGRNRRPGPEAAPAEPGIGPHDPQADNGSERQVHPVLDDHLRRPRDKARGGQYGQEPEAKETEGRRAPVGRKDARDQGEDRQRPQRRRERPGRPEGAVAQDERVGPDAEPKVARDRLALGERVVPPAGAHAEADRAAAVAAARGDEECERDPGGGQGCDHPAVAPPGLPVRAGIERAVIDERHDRGRHHDLLGSHAEQARADGGRPPPRRRLSPEAPDEAVEGEEVEKAHERLGPLDRVRDRLGLEGMHRPHGGRRQCEGQRRVPEAGAHAGHEERPAHGAKEDQPGGHVDQEVRIVVARRVESPEGVVEREAKVQDRPSLGRRRLEAGIEDGADLRDPPDARVLRYRARVVEDERPVEAAVVGGEPRGRYEPGGKQDGPPRPGGCRLGEACFGRRGRHGVLGPRLAAGARGAKEICGSGPAPARLRRAFPGAWPTPWRACSPCRRRR